MNIRHLLLLTFLTFCFSNLIIGKQDIPERPRPPRLVNDYLNILSAQQKSSLENKLVKFNNSSSTQIVIVIIGDLSGYDKAEFAYKIGEEWGVGQKGKDNGIVILVKPTGGQGQRKTYIAVGYGLEGIIPDAIAKRIVDHELLPNFKNNRFYDGLYAATDVLISLSLKEFKAEDYVAKTKKKFGPPLIMIIFFILIILFSRLVRVRSYSSTNSIPFWTAFWLMGSMGGHHSGAFGNFSSGGGSFGGFGGGGFGGGGAGGSW